MTNATYRTGAQSKLSVKIQSSPQTVHPSGNSHLSHTHTFRNSASSERRANARNVSFRIPLRWPIQLIKPNYHLILPPTQHHSFFRNLPSLFVNIQRFGLILVLLKAIWEKDRKLAKTQPNKSVSLSWCSDIFCSIKTSLVSV